MRQKLSAVFKETIFHSTVSLPHSLEQRNAIVTTSIERFQLGTVTPKSVPPKIDPAGSILAAKTGPTVRCKFSII